MKYYICDHANKFPECKKCIHSRPHQRQEIVHWIHMHDANYWCNEHTACDPDIIEDTPRWHRPYRKQGDRTCRTQKEYKEIGLRKVKCIKVPLAQKKRAEKRMNKVAQNTAYIESAVKKELDKKTANFG